MHIEWSSIVNWSWHVSVFLFWQPSFFRKTGDAKRQRSLILAPGHERLGHVALPPFSRSWQGDHIRNNEHLELRLSTFRQLKHLLYSLVEEGSSVVAHDVIVVRQGVVRASPIRPNSRPTEHSVDTLEQSLTFLQCREGIITPESSGVNHLQKALSVLHFGLLCLIRDCHVPAQERLH